ncbi:MAG: transporter substrate-binding domain-containing protein [Thalassospira sp.]|uniref:hypothetical protein n=1 Tax=Thalassospira sp. TaxID=1912094 RepID=UPI0032ED81E0
MRLPFTMWLLFALFVGGVNTQQAQARNCLDVSTTGDYLGLKVGETLERLFAFKTPCFIVSYLPTVRSSQMLIAGEIDGELLRIADFPPYKNADVVMVPVPLIDGKGILVSSDPDITSVENVGRGVLGVLRGIEWSTMASKGNVNRVLLPTAGVMVDMFNTGRLDAFLIDNINLRQYENKLVDAHKTVVMERDAYIWLAGKHRDLVPEISRVLEEFYADGNSFLGS